MRPLFWTVLTLVTVVTAAVMDNLFTPELFSNPAGVPVSVLLTIGAILFLLISLIDGLLLKGREGATLEEFKIIQANLEKQLRDVNAELESVRSESERREQKAKVPPSDKRIDATVLQLLGQLQEKGRLLDFAMEDISSQSDDRVGAVARVVHQGVKEVLQEHFSISPLSTNNEGEAIELDSSYDASEIKIVGAVKNSDRISGSVVHRGWQTETVSLPRVNEQVANTRVIQPTIVEVK